MVTMRVCTVREIVDIHPHDQMVIRDAISAFHSLRNIAAKFPGLLADSDILEARNYLLDCIVTYREQFDYETCAVRLTAAAQF